MIEGDKVKLIVGLGNPGKEYENTRHNIGFMVIDKYLNQPSYQEKFNAYYLEKNINGEKVIFIKPKTFMNNSGVSVGKFADYYKVLPEDILVIQDDLDESIGSYKLKHHSSSGGHNGIKSIISVLHTDSFPRLKIGIKNESLHDTIDFVLGKLSKNEMNIFNNNIDIYMQIIDSYIENGIDKTMNVYNKK